LCVFKIALLSRLWLFLSLSTPFDSKKISRKTSSRAKAHVTQPKREISPHKKKKQKILRTNNMSCLSSSFLTTTATPMNNVSFNARNSSMAGCAVTVPQTVRFKYIYIGG
jgi:hypothetical protein